jgi:hypothetical protein
MDDGNLLEIGRNKCAETSDGWGQKATTESDLTGKREALQR